MILDCGAIYSSISWDVAKDIGYDPAISVRRTPQLQQMELLKHQNVLIVIFNGI